MQILLVKRIIRKKAKRKMHNRQKQQCKSPKIIIFDLDLDANLYLYCNFHKTELRPQGNLM